MAQLVLSDGVTFGNLPRHELTYIIMEEEKLELVDGTIRTIEILNSVFSEGLYALHTARQLSTSILGNTKYKLYVVHERSQRRVLLGQSE